MKSNTSTEEDDIDDYEITYEEEEGFKNYKTHEGFDDAVTEGFSTSKELNFNMMNSLFKSLVIASLVLILLNKNVKEHLCKFLKSIKLIKSINYDYVFAVTILLCSYIVIDLL
tara:strand:+ start:1074 stop:1412 length:339 start_codon:yes stop_codon:yes gene_type:complete